jgi:TRAP-type C4-dicarboxylate transport system permease small subunit
VTGLRSGVERTLEWILITLMAFMVVNVLWQVATRFLLRSPSSYTEELARFLLIWVGLLGSAYAAGTRSHLAIDLLPSSLKGAGKQLWVICVESCIFGFALIVLVVGGARLVQITLSLGQTSAAVGVPLGYVYVALPLSGLLMMFFAVLHVVEAVGVLRRGSDG